MRHHYFAGRSSVLALLLLAGVTAARADAATFSVNPTQIFLSHSTASALLALRNDSTQTLRFELSVFAWSQSPSGEMTLEPTQDVVFFPSLLTLKPSEERKVRVGRVTPAGAHEKTYRIFVKELPPVDANSGGGVRVLTTMGIPIFVRPARQVATAELTALNQSGGHFEFTLANTGTVHFLPQQIMIRGLGGNGQLFERKVDGWYILAATRRQFVVPLPEDTCSRVTSLLVEVEFGSTTLQERLQSPAGACRH